MSNYGNNNQPFAPAPELRETMTGSSVNIGTLIQAPVKIIFDNQSTVDVEISINDSSTVWKTFTAGEALILDCDLGTFPIGTTFYGDGASGNFSISYLYIRQ